VSTGDPPPWKLALGLGTIYFVWGSTYVAIRVMVETVPPLLGAGVRFALAGSVMLLVLRRRVRVPRRQIAAAGLVGLGLCLGGNGLVTVAEQKLPSSLAALLLASIPLWVVLLRTVSGDRVPRGTLVGVLAGFVGVAALLLPGTRPAGVPIGYSLLALFAAACWATATWGATKLPVPSDPLVSTAWQMVIGGAVICVVAVVSGELSGLHPSHFSGRSVFAFSYLVVVGSVIAFSTFAWLLKNAPVSLVATYAFVNPIVAVLLGALLLSESLTAATTIGAAVIVLSVAWTVTSANRANRRAAAARA
jgi:drug/metabolite transporter (DMT)-like permease